MTMRQHQWPNTADIPGLSAHQQEQSSRAMSSPLGILAGTPGTGKTFTVAGIVHQILRRYGAADIACAAPTGKAAVRMTETMQQQYGLPVVASTIHQLLEVGRNGHDGQGWGFMRNAREPLDQLFVFADEMSMADTELAASLLEAIPRGGHLLLIGDPYQLPPVGTGAPLRDLIASGRIGYGELNEIRRNAGLIVEGCQRIKDWQPFQAPTELDLEAGKNWKHFAAHSVDSQVRTLTQLLMQVPPNVNRVWDVQVIVAVNESGPLARKPLNEHLQKLLNPQHPLKEKQRFTRRDKVICTSNCWLPRIDYFQDMPLELFHKKEDREPDEVMFVANGELAHVAALDEKVAVLKLQSSSQFVLCSLQNDDAGECAGNKFDLGYAITCHKSQGSQAKVIIALIDDSNGANWVTCREWWYTACSRAERVLFTVGDWSVLWKQAKRVTLQKRKTFLREILTADVGNGANMVQPV